MDATGAAMWTIEGPTDTHWLTGTGVTPGTTNDQSAYCNELFGLWGIIFVLSQLTKEYAITQGRVTIACDSLLALWQATLTASVNPGMAHYDLIGAIQNLQQKLPLTISFKHVKESYMLIFSHMWFLYQKATWIDMHISKIRQLFHFNAICAPNGICNWSRAQSISMDQALLACTIKWSAPVPPSMVLFLSNILMTKN